MRLKALAPLAALVALLAVPAISFGNGTPTTQDQQNASKLCKAQRAAMGATAFKGLYGTNANKSNALGKCVSRLAKQQAANRENAAKACKAEQKADLAAFKAKYGTNKNKANAYGNCVSQKAKQRADKQQQATINAAKTCKAERAQDPAAFKAKYGTNKSKSNAFGKCVSQHAKAK